MDIVNKKFLFKGKAINKLLVILFATLICSVLVISSADDSAGEINNEFILDMIDYRVISEDLLIVEVYANSGITGELIIPSTVKNDLKTYNVTSIGNDAFKNCSDLTSITLPDSITSIGDEAFWNCSGLTTLTMPIDIRLTEGTFNNCINIMSVTLTPGQTGVGKSYTLTTFFNYYEHTPWHLSRSNLLSLTITEGVTSIGGWAFYNCFSLTSVTIPNSVTLIHEGAFTGYTFHYPNGGAIPQNASDLAGYTYSGSNYNDLVRGVDPFTVSFISEEETILSYKLGPGATIFLPDYSITKESTAQYEYIFGWKGYSENMKVTEDTIFKSKLTETLKPYNITWIIDGSEFTTNVNYSDTPVCKTVVTDQYTYTIRKWDVEPIEVTGPATYHAEIFEKTLTPHTITWMIEESEYTTKEIYGNIPIYWGETPSKVETDQYTFTFNKWADVSGDEPVTVAGPITYTAVFDEIAKPQNAVNKTLLYVGIVVMIVAIISLVAVVVIRSKNKA